MALLDWIRRGGSNVVSNTVGYATGTAASSAITPAVQPIANELWAAAPNVPLSPADAAAMVVQAILGEDEAAREAAMSGINRDRFAELVRLNGSPPGPQELLSLWDRGAINEEDVNRGLHQSRLKNEWIEPYKQLQRELLTAPTLAEMVVQGIRTEAETTPQAKHVSIEPEDFHDMVLMAGSPPGPMEMLDLWNRGEVSEADVDRALKQSRLKPEWVDTVKILARRVLTPSVAAELVLKQRIPFDEGARIAKANGMSAEDFRMLSEVNGRPVGIGQALTLFNRGEMTRADVEQVVARSDVRTEYTDSILALRFHYPSLFQVGRALQNGTITDELAADTLAKQGYTKEWITAVVAAGHAVKTTKHRQATEAQVLELWESGFLTEAEASGALKDLGYDDHEATMILETVEARRLVTYLTALLRTIHSGYVNSRVSEDNTMARLDETGVGPEARNRLMALWRLDRTANVKRLTEGQIERAVKGGRMPPADAYRRFIEMGYPDEDARELVAHAAGLASWAEVPT